MNKLTSHASIFVAVTLLLAVPGAIGLCRPSVLKPQWTYDLASHGYDQDWRSWQVAAVSRSAVLFREGGHPLVAVDRAMGTQLWASDAPRKWPYYPLMDWWRLLGSDDALCATYDPAGSKMEIRSVRTGDVVAPNSQSATDLFENTQRLVAFAGAGAVFVADLLSGSARRLGVPRDYQIDGETYVVFRDEGRVCVRIDTNDGGMGHSVWAKYLYCCNLAGKRLWQFPTTFRRPYPDSTEVSNSVTRALYVKPARVVVAVVRDDMYYGLRSRDGRLLWHKNITGLTSPATFRGGVLCLYTSAKGSALSSLVYIDAKTGARKVIGSVPRSDMLFVVGDAVFVAEETRLSMLQKIPNP